MAARAEDTPRDDEKAPVVGAPAARPSDPAADWRASALASSDEAFAALLACECPHPYWARAGVEQGIEARLPASRHATRACADALRAAPRARRRFSARSGVTPP